MSRYVSFGVLIAVILFLGIIFYRVMAAFILPIFLATVLVVVFGPVHQWVLEKTKQRKTLAAALTTSIIGLAVILPIGGIGIIAYGEARHLFKNLSSGGIEQNFRRVRKSLNLEMPAPAEFRQLDKAVRTLDVRNVDELALAETQLDQIDESADRFELAVKIPKPDSDLKESMETPGIGVADIERWRSFRDTIRGAREVQLELFRLQEIDRNSSAGERTATPKANVEKTTGEKGSGTKEVDESPVKKQPDESQNKPATESDENKTGELATEFRKSMEQIVSSFDQFRLQTLGGGVYAYFKEIANPSPEEAEEYNDALIDWIQKNFLSLGGKATQFLIGVVVDSSIMMIAVFFFLLDGPRMIAALKFFSPLDDRHEQELIDEFGKVCRAVMVATLCAAAVQGLLAGIGYYFAGVEAVFLLTLSTGFLAMVPFVGAAAVWVPTCFYLYLVDDRLVPAILLAIWGTGVVSTIDNVIKPYILHGQSNIHPLLALLSVLGGVSALGPIGILVGPLVVAFLQTTLTVLQREIQEMDLSDGNGNGNGNSGESNESQSAVTVVVDEEATDSSNDDESNTQNKNDS